MKGIAGSIGAYPQDAETLNVSWWYNWMVSAESLDDPLYVPMLPTGETDPDLPSDYAGYVLIFNEPDIAKLAVETAATRYATLLALYPSVQWVAGGVTSENYQWLVDFRDYLVENNIALPARWHMHGYCGSGISVAQDEAWMAAAYAALGGTWWITEYNSFDGVTGDAQAVTRWIRQQAWVERYSIFTNREPSYPLMCLVNNDGSLGIMGRYYQTIPA